MIRGPQLSLIDCMIGRKSLLSELWKQRGRMNRDTPIVVAGAGSIGCFVGGMLAGAGPHVGVLARPRVISDIES